MQTKQIDNSINKFHNAEKLWFWFISSKGIRNGFRQNNTSESRPCELVDIETLVTRLYLAGKLSATQLKVMKEFGDRRRAPNQHIYSENKAAAIWADAMKTIGAAAFQKGWTEFAE